MAITLAIYYNLTERIQAELFCPKFYLKASGYYMKILGIYQ
jgi:hypothetical protein